MAGIDQHTGRIIVDGWEHTCQSVAITLTTAYGERVERRHVGALIPRLFGENLTTETLARFVASIPLALAVIEKNGLPREPRFALRRALRLPVTPETTRRGYVDLYIDGEYRPRGHLGDPTSAGIRAISLIASGNRFIPKPIAVLASP